ncbi:hypothetical protein [Oxalicibacterium faecigallinarum]|uniref:Uncharacterized protein n=1 Tax=Oxalicibacterium faecigallinarum TaxID=573741 RepID=A0A8J3ANK4_9BURK|nr:hypothetical protein [Oxalicibacterium faecigallinarum]GGI16919.1 hypothetical protein GCM10008066_06370 [Oxalicibacterium faecigallinarum]
MGARPDTDLGDRDSGDHDATEVISRPVDIRHMSHAPANLPAAPTGKTPIGEKYLESLRQRPTAPVAARSVRRDLVSLTCWKDTPQLYRKMIARVAGLSGDVVEKRDRDLTETEKAMLRSAIADMRQCFQGLVSL